MGCAAQIESGRYLQPEPLMATWPGLYGYTAKHAGSQPNPYGYALNNPVNRTDRDGRFPFDWGSDVVLWWINSQEFFNFNNWRWDKFFHCKTSCEISQTSSPLDALLLGGLKESGDLTSKACGGGVTKADAEDSLGDEKANLIGIGHGIAGDNCVAACLSLAPH